MTGLPAFLGRAARQALNIVGLLATVVVLNFLLIQTAPGDPAQVIAGEMGGASPEVLAQIRAQYGLDRSLPEQLLTYLGKVAQGDLGYSFYFNQPVTGLILNRLPATLLLVVSALFVAVVVGAGLGALAARKPTGALSRAVSVGSTAAHAAPVFWTGLMLLVLFSSLWPVLPVAGMVDPAARHTGLAYVLDVLSHLVLPTVTLAIVYIAQYSRLMRASMIDALHADYVRTARAKGLPERVVMGKHALRNALIPLVTVVGMQFGQMFAGAVLVETVFSWPGLGRLVFDSILRRDYPTLLGILFFSALLVVLVNLLTDALYRLIDPRIRTGRAA
jgi:peptide/nickel transport system permease protein